MAYATIDALRESLAHPAHKVQSPEYAAKMLHTVPQATVVDRIAFVLERCRGRRVLELGASGKLHDEIVKSAAELFGVDKSPRDTSIEAFDLDVIGECQDMIPGPDGIDVVVCGEVLEHLSNPGWTLSRLRNQWPGAELIVTVPNAFSAVAVHHMERGVENVNRDHVAWYSTRTLQTLLERHGFTITEWHWYNGEPLAAEGLIAVARMAEK
jgi:2-polyprenyl-6-hydroxyphenyl methylase/3-demethylubiquinone-9 3-methyltransferase